MEPLGEKGIVKVFSLPESSFDKTSGNLKPPGSKCPKAEDSGLPSNLRNSGCDLPQMLNILVFGPLGSNRQKHGGLKPKDLGASSCRSFRLVMCWRQYLIANVILSYS